MTKPIKNGYCSTHIIQEDTYVKKFKIGDLKKIVLFLMKNENVTNMGLSKCNYFGIISSMVTKVTVIGVRGLSLRSVLALLIATTMS